MRKSLVAWVAVVILILLLYLGAVGLFANRIHPLIFGMPFLYFWYVLVPLLNPVILGALYLYDRRRNPQNDEIHWTGGK
ncbi:DUF3311 domain-containing protein [Alicyclobacillus curvatus]|jgi:predicted membrane metal-binding protein|nr:DUF3311 domain-containing protein [Alicyclobacillus curvatus]